MSNKQFCYEYPRPAVAADVICIRKSETGEDILLVQRKNEPFRSFWAFPGGFMEMNETTLETAKRELWEETGLKVEMLHFLCIADNPHRDPRFRCISAIYYCLIENNIEIKAGDDAANVQWFDFKKLPALAFDHKEIIDRYYYELIKCI
ncbi:MAG: NUDIX hydrolase [Bacteroidales bacterium]